ncbi:MAG: formylglycine-generating enzyme family protein [Methylococcales bacterium]|nr:formylglycine-generating enzyme family protein [Methylococcales bacterium]
MKQSNQHLKIAILLMGTLLAIPTLQAAENAAKSTNGIAFVKIAPGCFQMGGDAGFKETGKAELPAHRVCIEKAFYLGETEVTQAQWTKVMGSNPSKFNVGSNPVEQVSWEDVQAFLTRLNATEGSALYRLPTEAEWEYAARAGSSAHYSFGDSPSALSSYAWYGNEGYGGRTSPVAQKQPNAWGLYDMQGNVWEWVSDWYGDTYYSNSPEKDPKGPEAGKFRVYRGGSWIASAGKLRLAVRYSGAPNSRSRDLGFRLVRQAE